MNTIAIAALGLLFLIGCFVVVFAGAPHPLDGDDDALDPNDTPQHRHASNGKCALCDAPLRPSLATTDEVVRALENRIADTRAAISELLANPEPANIKRLYVL